MIVRNRDVISGVLVLLVIASILAWIAAFDLSQPQFLKVTFFDVGLRLDEVGQGNAVLTIVTQ